jgi:hypothetical protein
MQLPQSMVDAFDTAQNNKTYFVIELTHDNHTWISAYPGNSEESALKLAAYDHSDLLPNLLLVCLGIEH